jgi:hypothetical protein
VDGLARLGVGVSDAAAEELVATVSRGGAPFFRYYIGVWAPFIVSFCLACVSKYLS